MSRGLPPLGRFGFVGFVGFGGVGGSVSRSGVVAPNFVKKVLQILDGRRRLTILWIGFLPSWLRRRYG